MFHKFEYLREYVFLDSRIVATKSLFSFLFLFKIIYFCGAMELQNSEEILLCKFGTEPGQTHPLPHPLPQDNAHCMGNQSLGLNIATKREGSCLSICKSRLQKDSSFRSTSGAPSERDRIIIMSLWCYTIFCLPYNIDISYHSTGLF